MNSGGTTTDEDFIKCEIESGVNFENPAYLNLMAATWVEINRTLHPKSSFEIGAGTGVLLGYMVQVIDAHGIDPMQMHLDYFTRFNPDYKDRYTKALIQDYEFTREFDLAVSIEVFEHIPLDLVLEVLPKIAKHCAYFWFSSTPEKKPGWDEEWGHINVNSREEWIAIFERSGWKFFADSKAPTRWTLVFKSECYG